MGEPILPTWSRDQGQPARGADQIQGQNRRRPAGASGGSADPAAIVAFLKASRLPAIPALRSQGSARSRT
ncbi:MAG: hypothetical protein ACKO8I_11835 [Cyanobacteriota bacterium]